MTVLDRTRVWPSPVLGGSALRAVEPGDPGRMGHRARWLLALHLLVPGSPQVLAGNRRLGRVVLRLWLAGWLALLAAVALWFVLPQVPLTLFTTSVGLTVVQIVLVAVALLWAVLTIDTLRLVRFVHLRGATRVAVPVLLVAALVVGSGAAAYGAGLAGSARGTLGTVFGASRYTLPAGGRYNIMLLGGDAGKGRSGLRPDSISVVSIDAVSGRMVTFGLPRNLGQVPFAAGSPMRKTYPHGYGWHDTCDVDVCQLNSIYTEVQLKSPGRYPNAVKEHSLPGIEATRDAVEGALGIDVQYYALIDMGSMEHLIDALGGVTIDVKHRLPIGGGVDANGTPTGVKVWIEKGRQHLNGNRALWYARSRHGTSDYDRMARQRELQAAILKQVNPVTVLTKFDAIGKAGASAVRTDIPEGLVGEFTGLAVKARGQKPTTIEFVPPRVRHPEHPDYAAIHAAVRKALG